MSYPEEEHKWLIEEGSGSTLTDSAGTKDLTGNSNWVSSGLSSHDYALEFNDTSSDSITESFYFSTHGQSYSVWVCPYFSDSYGGDHTIFREKNNSDNNWGLMYDGSGYWETKWSNSRPSFQTSFDSNTWHHIAVTISEGGGATFYWDGEEIGTSSTDEVNSSDTLYIGEHPDQNNYWHGKLDDIRFWNTELTQSEVQEVYNEGMLSSPSVSASVNSNDEIGLSISPPSDWGVGEGNYHVQLNRDGNGWTDPSGGPTEPDSSTTNPTYGPSSDSSYGSQVGIDSEFQFRARAENSAGSSDWATSSTVYTDPIPPHDPSISRPSANEISVTFDHTQSDVLTHGELWARKDTGNGYGDWFEFGTLHTSEQPGATFTLDSDARYQFRMRTRNGNASDNSRYSEWVYADYGNEGNVFFEDDFEDDLSAWSLQQDGNATITNSSDSTLNISGPDEGNSYVKLEGNTLMVHSLGDMSNESGVHARFVAAAASSTSSSDTIELLWRSDATGGSWVRPFNCGPEYNKQGWVEFHAKIPESDLGANMDVAVDTDNSNDHLAVDRFIVSDVLHEYTKPTAPSNPSLEAESSSELQGSWSLNHAFADDVETWFGPADGSLSGTNRSHALVSTAFDGLDDGTEYELEVNAAVHQYRHGEKETEWDSDRTDTVSARTILDAVRSVESHAEPITSSAERTIDVDRSTESHTGSVSSESDRVLEYERSAESHVNPVSSSSSRISELHRTTATTGEASIDSMQALRPVFPSEESLDVQWDFDVDQMAFATEWLDEDSHIPTEDRDGVGVVLNGRLDTTIDVWVQYDETGDGVPDVTSSRQEMSRTTKTLAFDDHRLFGEDGWYRVVVQGLRDDDVINQVDVGPVHKNL